MNNKRYSINIINHDCYIHLLYAGIDEPSTNTTLCVLYGLLLHEGWIFHVLQIFSLFMFFVT